MRSVSKKKQYFS